MKQYLQINETDNVAVALSVLPKGTVLTSGACGEAIVLMEEIPQGHKFALRTIRAGEAVIKYGAPIGTAVQDIPAGTHVHTHNIRTNLSDTLQYAYEPAEPAELPAGNYTFCGYRRADGRTGIRNDIWILPTVGCVNDIVKRLEREWKDLASENDVNGGPVQKDNDLPRVMAFTHPYGCSQMGEDQENFRKIFADLVHHPNAGGVLIVGLGCENSNIAVLKEYIGRTDPKRVKYLNCQEEDDEIAAGLSFLKELYDTAAADQRVETDASELIVGMKCGGSDGLSGITANPVIGGFSDRLIGAGGSTILTEVPEMFGAETLLMNRAEDQAVFEKTVSLINDFKAYFKAYGQTIYENPSPGNKEGGISTLEDKALGCTQKSGSAAVKDVLPYTGSVEKKGLNLLYAPGNDMVASTALAAAGAQLLLFSTGRGTPWAACVPTVKLSSNTALSDKKKNWIDFDAGRAVTEKSIAELSEELLELVLRTASGEKLRSETDGYYDIAVFKQGVTL